MNLKLQVKLCVCIRVRTLVGLSGFQQFGFVLLMPDSHVRLFTCVSLRIVKPNKTQGLVAVLSHITAVCRRKEIKKNLFWICSKIPSISQTNRRKISSMSPTVARCRHLTQLVEGFLSHTDAVLSQYDPEKTQALRHTATVCDYVGCNLSRICRILSWFCRRVTCEFLYTQT